MVATHLQKRFLSLPLILLTQIRISPMNELIQEGSQKNPLTLRNPRLIMKYNIRC